jgi:hypothetical protein
VEGIHIIPIYKKGVKAYCNNYCGISVLSTSYKTIKSRKMRWPGHVAKIGEKRNAYRLLVEKQRE